MVSREELKKLEKQEEDAERKAEVERSVEFSIVELQLSLCELL